MSVMEATEAPSGHSPEGGVLVGSEGARRRLVVFEDPQCPYCREFEDVSGDRLRREVAAGAVAVEYRIRSFLGEESVRAANALAVAAEAGGFDELRREIFVNQPPEHSGGFTTEDLLDLGRRAGLTGTDFVTAVKQGRYESWVREIDEVFEGQDPHGTPFAVLDGHPVDSETLYDADALNVPLVRGQDVAAVVERDCAVPSDALPRHGVRLDRVEQRNPQVLVLDGLLAALPAVALPLGKPSLCERARQVGRIRVDRERRRAAKCQQPFQGCSQFHAVVRRHILAAVAFELLRHSAVSAPGDEDERPTARSRIP